MFGAFGKWNNLRFCPVCAEKLHLNAFDLIIIGDVLEANVSQYICNSRHAWEAAWTTKNLSAKYISINVLLSVCKRQIYHIFAALNLFEIPRSLSFEYSVIFSGILWAICHGNASTKGALHAAWRLGFDAPATFVFADEVLARRIPVGMRQNLDQFLVLCSIPKNIPYSLDFRDGH